MVLEFCENGSLDKLLRKFNGILSLSGTRFRPASNLAGYLEIDSEASTR